MNDSERAVRAHLERIDRDRATLAHERALLDSWGKSLDREERMARRALEVVDESGQTRLINPVTGRSHVASTRPEQRQAILDLFADSYAPPAEFEIPDYRTRDGQAVRLWSQRDLERLSTISSGTVSRLVRDLESEGSLHRVGRTGKGSPLWTTDRPEDDPR